MSATIVNEPEDRWSPLSALTVLVLAVFVLALVNVLWSHSIIAVIGFALGSVWTYFVVAGCARRGDPIARWLLRRRIRN